MSDFAILGREVAIEEIDRELKMLWKADEATTKASLMNFAVYSEAENALIDNTSLIREITREHACRAILIGVGLEQPESLARAWITAHCNLVGGRKAVCSEQISFQLNGKAIGRIRNIVFAHLESDLPLVLWWQGTFSRIFEPKFFFSIDRLIVDSDAWENPTIEFEILRSAMDKASNRLVLHDLSWTRSFFIRTTLAGVFDDHSALSELNKLKNIHIKHSPDHRMTAIQLMAWISTRLGWELLTKESQNAFVFQSNSHSVNAVLEPVAADSSPISSIELRSENGCFHVTRDPLARFLHCSIKVGSHSAKQISPAGDDSPSGLVSSQLARAGNNQLFRAILPDAIELL